MSDTSGADTVDPAATDRRGLRVLGFEECLQRLHDAPVGRVGFLRDGEIAILPVNHVVGRDGHRVPHQLGVEAADRRRRGAGGLRGRRPRPALSTGWSVLVHGTARSSTRRRTAQRLDAIAETVDPLGHQHLLGAHPARGDHRPGGPRSGHAGGRP